MIDIRIVCTHDAVKLAETLMRLLEAEEHVVQLAFGRQSLAQLETAKTSRDAVVLIWSNDAPSQTYMLEWLHGVDPARVVEIARAPGWPARTERKAQVIDFTTWRGERGARAWNALNERLRQVARVVEPPRPPPKRAALALGLASVAAVGGALMVRMNDTVAPAAPMDSGPVVSADDAIGMGGSLEIIEPASREEIETIARVPLTRTPPLDLTPPAELAQNIHYELDEIREPTLIERLTSLNPLRSPDESDGQ